MSDKDQMIELLTKLNKQLEAQNREQAQTIRELRTMIANLQETLDEFRRKLFGKSSEKTGTDPSAEQLEEEIRVGEETLLTVKEHTRTKNPKSLRKDLYESLPVKDVYCDIPEGDRKCPDCDAEMEHLGYKFTREELRITPARIERVKYYRETMVCPACREELVTTIIEGRTPTPLLPHSPASQSMVATVMYEKSGIHLPFYRQEQDWLQKEVPLPRETLAGWYNKCALKYLLPVYDLLHVLLVTERDLIHADEVPCQVLNEPGRAPEQKSYMWLYLTGTDGLPPIILYDYQQGRGGNYPREFLLGFSGMIHCDGYQAYGTIENVIILCCLAHCRRKFFEAIPKEQRKKIKLLDINSDQEIADPGENTADRTDLTTAEKGVVFCNRLFYKERLFKDLPPEERKARRDESEPRIWEEFWSWIETLNPAGGSKLGKAVTYALNHKETLMNYLKDGRCEISNNAAERRVKSYVMSRKNFLFHDSVDGAKASAIVLSLIETAKANNLNVFQYLYTLLLYMPDHLNSPEGIEQLLPWSDFIQEHCRGPINVETMLPENKPELPV